MNKLEVLPIASEVKFSGTEICGKITAISMRGIKYQVQYEVTYWQDGRKSIWVNEEEVFPTEGKNSLNIGFING